jgi:hypothetical protein
VHLVVGVIGVTTIFIFDKGKAARQLATYMVARRGELTVCCSQCVELEYRSVRDGHI